jgi:hypothetical protein
MKSFLTFGFVMILLANSAWAANQVDPSAFALRVYETRISESADCSGSFLTVFRSESPTELNMLDEPTLGSGVVPNGTYRCVAIRMSDMIDYTPAETTDNNNCVAGTPYSKDIAHGETTTSPEGTDTVTVDGAEDVIWIYLSTNGTESGSGFVPDEPCPLGSPLVVTSDRSSHGRPAVPDPRQDSNLLKPDAPENPTKDRQLIGLAGGNQSEFGYAESPFH